MVEFDPYLISVIAFFFILAIVIYKDRKNIDFKYILLMRRTKRFRDTIDRIAQKSPRFWKVVGTIGIVVAFGAMFLGVYSLLEVGYNVYTGKITQPALQFVLPTASSSVSAGPGYILIPFWFWFIVISVILVPHELFHGIISRAENIRLKSVGLLLLAIFPGAFVEPDDKQLKKAKKYTQLRIFAAGSFINIVIASIVFAFILFVLWPSITFPAVTFDIINVNESSPAELAGVRPNITIAEVNDKPIVPTYLEHLRGFDYASDEIGIVRAGDTVTLKDTDGKIYKITIQQHPTEAGRTYSGIQFSFSNPFTTQNEFIASLFSLLSMIWILSFAVAIVNILPIYPLDGGYMFDTVARKISKNNHQNIVKAMTYFILILLIYDFAGPLVTPLL